MQYYWAIKGTEVLIHAAIWMNPENIKLRESASQKITYYMISLISDGQNRQIYGDGKQMEGCLEL